LSKNVPVSGPTRPSSSTNLKRLISGSAGWAFGLGVTVLFVSVWGHAVVADSAGLGHALAPLSQTTNVGSQFTDWLDSELTDAGVQSDAAAVAAQSVLDEGVVDDVLNDLVVEVIAAAAEGGPEGSSVDLSLILAPAVSDITASLKASGVPASEALVAEVVASLEPIVIRAQGVAPAVGPASPVAARLSAASVLALVVIAFAGSMVVRVSEDRMSAIRGLLVRVALSGLSFGLMLRLGSWILDPSGGRAPVSQTLSNLAGFKWLVPVGIGALAAGVSGISWMFRTKVKQTEVNPLSSGEPILREG